MSKIYVFLYQNLNRETGIYVLDEGVDLCISILEFKCIFVYFQCNDNKIYVFLYQNLNILLKIRDVYFVSDLCISILEFK